MIYSDQSPIAVVEGGGTTNHGGTSTARVLIVDDDSSMQHMLATYLEQHNMRVATATRKQDVGGRNTPRVRPSQPRRDPGCS